MACQAAAGPNPQLRAFVEAHLSECTHGATDEYLVPPFDRPLAASKASPLYNMHAYWSKKPCEAIREYVRHYTRPGDLVLDPFCGSGSTALAVLLEGRRAIAVDRSPAATFITANYCTPVDLATVEAAFAEVMGTLAAEVGWLYETRCDRCGGPATLGYAVYEAPRARARPARRASSPVYLSDAGDGAEAAGPAVGWAGGGNAKGDAPSAGPESPPTLVSYLCRNGCRPARASRRRDDPDPGKRRYFAAHDLATLRAIADRAIPHWYPRAPFPAGLITRQPVVAGAATLDALWTKRNLWTLAAYREEAMRYPLPVRRALLFILTACIYNVSRMVRQSNTQYLPGYYYLPPASKEVNALASLAAKMAAYRALQRRLATAVRASDLVVSTQSAANLAAIPDGSVDYVFTDPPYGGKVQYAEANFGWEQWLGCAADWWDEEVIVNSRRGKTDAAWQGSLLACFKEIYRVLKPGRWLSLCYHEASPVRWSALQEVLAAAGFLPDGLDKAVYLDYNQHSYKQYTADTGVKRELVLSYRKPRAGEAAAGGPLPPGEESASRARALALVREYLALHPGATKDRLYDEVVSRLVRLGRLPARDFHSLLAEVALPVTEPAPTGRRRHPPAGRERPITRWYLRT